MTTDVIILPRPNVSTAPRIGLVLGGGGARGLGHLPVIEALDEMGLRASAVAGTSIGAIFGAGYAAGLQAREMREVTLSLFSTRASLLARLWSLRPRKFSELWREGGIKIGQIDAEKVLNLFVGDLLPARFEDLRLPLSVVATDFYGWGAHVIRSGPLPVAVAGSMAIPMLFKPVPHQGRMLMDGGIVNPVPVDSLPASCDIVIAVDVLAYPEPRRPGAFPTATESIFGAAQLLMQAVIREKLTQTPPDLLLRPNVQDFAVLDFLKTKEIIAATAPIKDEVKRKLDRMLGAHKVG